MKVIIVTGSPGAGKTTFAKALCEATGYTYVDLTALIERESLSQGFDKARDCAIVDTLVLGKSLKKELSVLSGVPGVVIDSHMSQDLGIVPDLCVVVSCPLDVLRSRLAARGYSKEKVEENLQCEIFDVCYADCIESGFKVEKVSGTDLDSSIRNIVSIL